MSTPAPYQNVYDKYRQTQITTASKEKLLLMVYEAGIKFARQGKEAVLKKDYEEANRCIQKTQDVVMELMLSLNMEAGDIATNLWRLYDYMYYRLIQSNVKKDPDMVEEVAGMLESLRNTWIEAFEKLQKEKMTAAERPHGLETVPGKKGGFSVAG